MKQPTGFDPRPRDEADDEADDELEDELEDLVVHCLAQVEESGVGALDELCRANPDSAPELRRRIDALLRAGLVEAPSGAPAPARLGDFTLHEPLGGGGMGLVYRATQDGLGREVALKVVRPELLNLPGSRARFRREVDAVAHLSHPHLVAVHAVGEHEGTPYLAMERVRGATLADVLEEVAGRDPARLSGRDLAVAIERRAGVAVDRDAATFAKGWTEAALAIGAAVASALEHAHRAGVLHRDVKPSNVMLGVDGRARLFDFGLALPEEADALTATGSIVGSLRYMAPEQAAGEATDRRSDVYGLGATLYELVALRPPFDERGREALRAAILAGGPPRVTRHNRAASRDAALVLERALERDPSRRYASAAALARDLERALHGRPVDARPAGPWRIAERFARRRPALAAALAVGALAAVGTPTAIAVQQRRANERISDALALKSLESARAEANLTTALNALSGVVGELGDDLLRESPGKREQAAELLLRASRAYGELRPQRTGDPALAWDHALLLRQTAEVLDGIGRDDEGRAANAEAESILRALVAERPDEPRLRLDLADTLVDGCDVLNRHGEHATSLARYAEAETLLGGLLEGDARYAIGAETRARALAGRRQLRIDVVQALFRSGRRDEALAAIEPALADAEAMEAEAHPDAARALLSTRQVRASLASELGRDEEALAEYADVLDACELRWAGSRDARGLDLLSLTALNYAKLLFRAGRHDELERVVPAGVAAAEELARMYPTTPDYRERLVDLLTPRAFALIARERYDDAVPLLVEAARANEQLLALRPGEPEIERELAMARHNLANLLVELDQRAEARAYAAPAVEALERLAVDDAGARRHAAFARIVLAQAELDRVRPDADALTAIVAERAPGDPFAWSSLAAALGEASARAAEEGGGDEAERYATAAVGAVERAATAGYPSRARLLRLRELEPLHGRADFDAALARLPE